VNLLPQQLYWFAKSREFDKAAHFNLFDCIECGACSYVCPSNIPLVQYYRFAKGSIRVLEQEAHKADHARMRFEARKARIEREEQEKELKRQERARAAAAKQSAKKEAPAPTDGPAPATVAAATGTATAADTATEAAADEADKLQTAAASTMKRYKDAQKALEAAEKNGSEHIEALRQKVDQLKARADAAKDAFLAAKAAEKSTAGPASAAGPGAESPGKDPQQDLLKAAKLEAAKTQVLLKKARKALDAAGTDNPGDLAALTQALADAETAATQAEAAMKKLQGVE
jgi:electron transport complex protein RnfC